MSCQLCDVFCCSTILESIKLCVYYNDFLYIKIVLVFVNVYITTVLGLVYILICCK